MLSFNNGPPSFRNDVLDIDAGAAANGLALNDHFHIRFQFYDDAYVPADGYAIDQVQVGRQAAHGLSTGWNLLSWSVKPAMGTVGDLLALCSTCDKAWTYDAWAVADPWKYWPGNLDVDETMGLWLHVTEPTTLTVFGLQPAGSSIELRAGWNLVRYPSQTARTVGEALSSITGKYTLVRTFDATDVADLWKEHDVNAPPYANDLLLMEPGGGYWLYVTEDCTWSVGP